MSFSRLNKAVENLLQLSAGQTSCCSIHQHGTDLICPRKGDSLRSESAKSGTIGPEKVDKALGKAENDEALAKPNVDLTPRRQREMEKSKRMDGRAEVAMTMPEVNGEVDERRNAQDGLNGTAVRRVKADCVRKSPRLEKHTATTLTAGEETSRRRGRSAVSALTTGVSTLIDQQVVKLSRKRGSAEETEVNKAGKSGSLGGSPKRQQSGAIGEALEQSKMIYSRVLMSPGKSRAVGCKVAPKSSEVIDIGIDDEKGKKSSPRRKSSPRDSTAKKKLSCVCQNDTERGPSKSPGKSLKSPVMDIEIDSVEGAETRNSESLKKSQRNLSNSLSDNSDGSDSGIIVRSGIDSGTLRPLLKKSKICLSESTVIDLSMEPCQDGDVAYSQPPFLTLKPGLKAGEGSSAQKGVGRPQKKPRGGSQWLQGIGSTGEGTECGSSILRKQVLETSLVRDPKQREIESAHEEAESRRNLHGGRQRLQGIGTCGDTESGSSVLRRKALETSGIRDLKHREIETAHEETLSPWMERGVTPRERNMGEPNVVANQTERPSPARNYSDEVENQKSDETHNSEMHSDGAPDEETIRLTLEKATKVVEATELHELGTVNSAEEQNVTNPFRIRRKFQFRKAELADLEEEIVSAHSSNAEDLVECCEENVRKMGEECTEAVEPKNRNNMVDGERLCVGTQQECLKDEERMKEECLRNMER